jgi:signal transduction histidine kinase
MKIDNRRAYSILQSYRYIKNTTSKILLCYVTIIGFKAFCTSNYIQAQANSTIDSAKKIASSKIATDEFIKTCFYIADEYMNAEDYDSAQLWLDKIYNVVPVKSNSLFHYLLITRQAEVYYYNNLQYLGLQESKRGLDMAMAMNDSVLMADSYNFLGLFYMNIDSLKTACYYFKKGIECSKPPPSITQYQNLTKPHHLFGNLAEAYFKLKVYDSALLNYETSLKKAQEIDWLRGIAVAYSGMADVYFATNLLDTAIATYNKSTNVAKKSNDLDVVLLNYGGLGKAYFKKNKPFEQKLALDSGFQLLRLHPKLNRFFSLIFLSNVIELYKASKNTQGLLEAYEIKSRLESTNLISNGKQIQTILNAGLQNEKRILNLEVEEARQKQKVANFRLIIAVIGILFLGLGFLIYRYYLNQKLKISNIRQKISQDLHDDIGATLSSLQLYSAVANKYVQQNPQKAQELLQKITNNTSVLMDTINDIVWSNKDEKEQTISFAVKVKNYITELFTATDIYYTIDISQEADDLIKSGTAKRNLLLIIKESMNNILKYSKATNVVLNVKKINNSLVVSVIDNGIGFVISKGRHTGNGLQNLQKRAEEIKGTLEIMSSPNKGTTIEVSVPIASINNRG